MSKGDHTSTPSTITHVEWKNFCQILQQRNVTDEDLGVIREALNIGESSGRSKGLSPATYEILLNLYHDDKALFDLTAMAILPIIHKDAEDHDGNSSLHLASKTGLQDIVKIILNNGTDPNIVNNNDYTPMHLAAQSGYAGVIPSPILNRADSLA